MAHRVQLSLQIIEDDFYEGFIEELKANRELNNKVINVLKAYYYNKDIREKVDAFIDGDEIKEDYDKGTNTDELFADIRNAMAMSNFYANEATQTLEDGTDIINDILNQTSKQAQDDGIINDVKTSEYGFEIPKLVNKVDEKNLQKVAKRVKNAKPEGNEAFFEKLVLKLCDMVGLDPNSVENDDDTEQDSVQETVQESVQESVQEETHEEKTVLKRPKPEKPQEFSSIFGEDEEEPKPVVKEEPKPVVKEEKPKSKPKPVAKVEEDEEDGFAALMASLGSIDI